MCMYVDPGTVFTQNIQLAGTLGSLCVSISTHTPFIYTAFIIAYPIPYPPSPTDKLMNSI